MRKVGDMRKFGKSGRGLQEYGGGRGGQSMGMFEIWLKTFEAFIKANLEMNIAILQLHFGSIYEDIFRLHFFFANMFGNASFYYT